jgi:hypothetical protein
MQMTRVLLLSLQQETVVQTISRSGPPHSISHLLSPQSTNQMAQRRLINEVNTLTLPHQEPALSPQ